jgi:hypothetical protein
MMSNAHQSSNPGWGFFLGLAGVVALMGGVAVWQDRVSGRALSNQQMVLAARAIDLLPDTFGEWQTEAFPMSEDEIRQTGTKSYYNRVVWRRRGGIQGSVMLLCGQTRELSVHPPTVCFQGAGLVLDGEARAVRMPAEVLGGEEGALMAAHFKPAPGVAKNPVFVYWGWSRDGRRWEAPDVPRLSFVGEPFLYKLYVIRDDTGRMPSEKNEVCDQILRDFLPEFHASIDRVAADQSVSRTP